MLTIKNIEKLTQYGAVGDWRVGKEGGELAGHRDQDSVGTSLPRRESRHGSEG